MNVKRKLLEDFSKISSATAPWVHRDLTRASWNLGNWRLMESPLLFLMRNHCILDPAGNPFEWEPIFGCENPYGRKDAGIHAELAERVRPRNLRWEGLGDRSEKGEDFDHCGLVPNPESPYLNRKGRMVANTLDKPRLRRVLGEQLGDRFDLGRDFADPDLRWRHGLACALILHAHSDKRRHDAERLIDRMNWSMGGDGPFDRRAIDLGHWGREAGFREIMGLHEELMADMATRRIGVRSILSNAMLARLLVMARRRGVVPTAFFGWVKAFDRTLWYALNQTGRAAASAEAAGVAAHIAVEDAMGMAFDRPVVEPAIEGFEAEMAKEGWLPDSPSAKTDDSTPENAEPEGKEVEKGKGEDDRTGKKEGCFDGYWASSGMNIDEFCETLFGKPRKTVPPSDSAMKRRIWGPKPKTLSGFGFGAKRPLRLPKWAKTVKTAKEAK